MVKEFVSPLYNPSHASLVFVFFLINITSTTDLPENETFFYGPEYLGFNETSMISGWSFITTCI